MMIIVREYDMPVTVEVRGEGMVAQLALDTTLLLDFRLLFFFLIHDFSLDSLI